MSSSKKDNGKLSRQGGSCTYKRSELERVVEKILRKANFNNFEIEFRFCERRWRFDFAWPQHMVALEVEGGVWRGGKGGHTSGVGFSKDCEKYNTATILNWKVIRITNVHLREEEKLIGWLGAVLPRNMEDDPFPVADPNVVI